MTRIIDKINCIRKEAAKVIDKSIIMDEVATVKPQSLPLYHSLEFFPPKTEIGMDNLACRIERMVCNLEPLFIDITWGAGGSTCDKSLSLAEYAQRYCGIDVLLHLTCLNMTFRDIKHVLDRAKAVGIQNILCLRGDTNLDRTGGDCEYAIELLEFIKKEYGNYFGLAVAGHPDKHPLSSNLDEEIDFLKLKVKAGADFIITQFFYDTYKFVDYVKKCRKAGITVPIIPGIVPIPSYSTFLRMTEFCQVGVPKEILQKINPVKNDDEAIKSIGCTLAFESCQIIFNELAGDIDGIHFYTLNLERSVTQILSELRPHLELTKFSNKSNSKRSLPFRKSALPKREAEQIRPINWANRPKSYINRTDDWDEFPNGRWGDASSPAFGDTSYFCHDYSNNIISVEERCIILGEHPTSLHDIQNVFVNFIQGDSSRKFLPWCCEGVNLALQPETFLLKDKLIELNKLGLWTINSQPAVNGVSSSDPSFGWGGSGGYVYQKPYCEFFTQPHIAEALVSRIKSKYPSISLYAVNHDQTKVICSPNSVTEENIVTALTWGVFPNREIAQPTIFDPNTYRNVWSEEAFSLWKTAWMNLYHFESEGFKIIEDIYQNFYLVAVLDNDYIKNSNVGGQLWDILIEIGHEIKKNDI